MRNIASLLLVVAITIALIAQERQTKLAVMEIDDKSGKLSKKLLDNAAEALRTELVASNKFIVISKDRQRQAMIKGEKKESWKECYDQSCRIQLGQALTADSILTGIVTYFGKKYTLTVELIDLAKEATVKAAKADFDGSEDGLAEAITDISSQLLYGKKAVRSIDSATKTTGASSSNVDTADLYDKARDLEPTDKERALELYHDIIEMGGTEDRYYQKARERLIKLGDAKIFRSACEEESDANACNEMGNNYMKVKRFDDASEAYAKACSLGSGWGCYGVAERLFYGEVEGKNNADIDVLYKKACSAGVKEGCAKQGIVSVVSNFIIFDNDTVYDRTTNLLWQRSNSDLMSWSTANGYCAQLDLGGYSGWRLPTISELRTLIRGCPNTQSGGACGVTDTCISYKNCKEATGSACDGCSGLGGPGEHGFYWTKGVWNYFVNNSQTWGNTVFWSSTLELQYNSAKVVSWGKGDIGGWEKDTAGVNFQVRCVRSGFGEADAEEQSALEKQIKAKKKAPAKTR